MSKKLILLSLAAGFLVAPSFVMAQGAYNYQGYNPNTNCQQSVNDGRTAGGIVGALAGAALGSNVAGRGVRTEGAVLGAVVGAVAGSQIGGNRIACDDQYQYERNRRSGDNRNYNYSNRPYSNNGFDGYNSYNNNYYNNNNRRHHHSYQYSNYATPSNWGNDSCGWGMASYALPNGTMVSDRVYMCRQRNGDWVVANR
jgi:Glycine zipper 2TM domain